MEGLFYQLEKSDALTLHLLKFYNDSNAVIAKKVTGSKLEYFKKELHNFELNGFTVKGEPEFTFWGAFTESSQTISFKVENEIADTSNTWVQKDILSFNGKILSNGDLNLTQVSKRTGYSSERIYMQANDEQLLAIIAQSLN